MTGGITTENQRFYICRHCENLTGMIHSSGVPIICCGEPMQALKANTVDASREKHIPAAEKDGDSISVRVGSVDHPMTDEHLIQWIYLETENGGQRKKLSAGDEPKVVFSLTGEKPVAVYAYCNLHGLWMHQF